MGGRFLADESVEWRIVEYLRIHGYDIVAIIEIQPGISDKEVMEIADCQKRILITNDKDFGELVFRRNLSHHGVILLRFVSQDIEIKFEIIKNVFKRYRLEKFVNRFTVISEKGLRTRR